jgi:23S rRNA (guanine2535-N1)-methyltransferase
MLTVLGFLHAQEIGCLLGSDEDESALEIATKNLTLLTRAGMESRIIELGKLHERFSKESHLSALADARKLQEGLSSRLDAPFFVFKSNILHLADRVDLSQVDIVIVDLPYGRLTDWAAIADDNNPIQTMLEELPNKIPSLRVVAVTGNKQQKTRIEGFEQVEKFQLGKRRTIIFSLCDKKRSHQG